MLSRGKESFIETLKVVLGDLTCLLCKPLALYKVLLVKEIISPGLIWI